MGLRILRFFLLAFIGAAVVLAATHGRTQALASVSLAIQETPEPTPPSEETPKPEPTPEPTVAPTPEPTPEQTPEPTATPSPEPALIMHSGSEHTESSSESTEITIGAPSPRPSSSASPSPSPTPNPWRQITVATKTLAPSSEGSIEVLGSFAAARRDGTSAVACISFKNTDARTATRVLFDFGLIDGSGANVGSLVLDRKGTFSTGIDIIGYGNLQDFVVHSGNRGYADNCTTLSMQMAALPLLSAKFATYAVKRVEYADGTSWDATANR